MAYVDLSRRFRDLTEDELEAPELLAYLNDRIPDPWFGSSRSRGGDGWNELLQHPRVLLLAEAGSGKTVEMREQAARLMADGKPAFFVPLESLDREPLETLLSLEQKRTLDAWRAEGHATAWFFLDAVDELKLTQGKLDRALNRFARAIDGFLHRAHVVISCRPSDWRPSVDMATLETRLPIVPAQTLATSPSEEIFLTALRGRRAAPQEHKAGPAVVAPRIVVLLPLGRHQIQTLARHLGVEDTPAFLEELRRHDAWTFARRPLDLSELVTSWKATGRLGTRQQQHAASVTARLKDDPDRADRDRLSNDKARLGAERLALALTLTRTRTIRSPEQDLDTERAESVLDPAGILTDWTEEERQTLLRRALFDPATYGRVRFHHRSVQEYLAARRLRWLRGAGMSAKTLRRLLFAERYSIRLVIPSMQAIAAWLAVWDEDVRRELMAREPETLLSMGDPESLSLAERTRLLRAFSSLYHAGGWRGLDIPIDHIRRLAHPELASVVRELWATKPTSPDVTGLLLEVIWLGSLEGCTDIACEAAFDSTLLDHQRVTAIRALSACSKAEVLLQVSHSIVCDTTRWPTPVVSATLPDLFPSFLNVSQLMSIIERAPTPQHGATACAWPLQEIAESADPWATPIVELRDALASLIWRTRQGETEWPRFSGPFDGLAPVLALLCDRQLESRVPVASTDGNLIWASVIANRFGGSEAGSHEFTKRLRRHFESSPNLREAGFWQEVRFAAEAVPKGDSKQRYFHIEYGSLVGNLTTDDRPWLLAAVQGSPIQEHRLIGLHALLRLWNEERRKESEFNEMAAAVREDAALIEVLRQGSKPVETFREDVQWRRQERRRQGEHERRERERVEGWLAWRQQLLSDPEAAFGGDELPTTRRNLYLWLEGFQETRTRYNVWDRDRLRRAFNEDIATRAAAAFQTTWRKYPPALWSQRLEEKRNSVLLVWCEGLTGLAAESSMPGWAARLTDEEARVAAAYATIELNQFASWLPDLVAEHPTAVDKVIGGELTSELTKSGGGSHLTLLQNLSYADTSLKRLLAPRLLENLGRWPPASSDAENSLRAAHQLGQALEILKEVDSQEQLVVAQICRRQFAGSPEGALALAWLRGLFLFDPVEATQVVEERLDSLPEAERPAEASRLFGSLFGHRDAGHVFADERTKAAVLGRLVRCAYLYVSPDEDQEHEGVYTPDLRDGAQRTREFLLGALLDTPGAETRRVVLDLADGPLARHLPDRLRLLARRRAAADAEPPPFSPEEVVELDKQLEAPPLDRDGLFTVMIDRLDDLAHDIAHDDFTDRRTLRTINEESEMQRTLAGRLRHAARGAYVISREDEVADSKKTDIRLSAVRGGQKAAIEVKIADSWSLADLERALTNQLVGRYLRHAECRAGCLLLTHNGSKGHWKHPKTRKRLGFAAMIEHLRHLVEAKEREMGHEVRLTIYPLDLTDPPVE